MCPFVFVCLFASREPSGKKLCDTPKSLSSPPTLRHIQIQAFCGFPNHHSSVILQEYILLHLMWAVLVSCHKAEQHCPCCHLGNFSHIAAHLWQPCSHLHMHIEADGLPAAELFKTSSSQHASEMKCHWQSFCECGLWGTFGAHAIGLMFQVGGVRRHACHVIPRAQYIFVMCVIQCCSLLLVQPLDIPSAALMSHHLTPPQH